MTLRPIAAMLLGGFLVACGTVEPRPRTNNDSLIAGPPLPARTVFPPGTDWNRDVSADSVDIDSDSLIARRGAAVGDERIGVDVHRVRRNITVPVGAGREDGAGGQRWARDQGVVIRPGPRFDGAARHQKAAEQHRGDWTQGHGPEALTAARNGR